MVTVARGHVTGKIAIQIGVDEDSIAIVAVGGIAGHIASKTTDGDACIVIISCIASHVAYGGAGNANARVRIAVCSIVGDVTRQRVHSDTS